MRQAAEEYLNIHASCVRLASAGAWANASPDAGVLLLGPSGIGKSDLVLRLIQDGALLVSDDRTELYVQNGALMARAPEILQGLLEIRGVGIVELACAAPTRVALAVLLEHGKKLTRLPEIERFQPPSALAVSSEICPPLLHLDPREVSATAKIAAAVAGLEHGRFPTSDRLDRASMSRRDR